MKRTPGHVLPFYMNILNYVKNLRNQPYEIITNKQNYIINKTLFTLTAMVKLKIFEPRHDKTNTMGVRPAKTQISLGIHPV